MNIVFKYDESKSPIEVKYVGMIYLIKNIRLIS